MRSGGKDAHFLALTIPFRKRLPFEVRKNLTPPTSACLGVGLLESEGPGKSKNPL